MLKPALSPEMLGVIVLSLVLALVLMAYDRMLKKMQSIRKRVEHADDEVHDKAERIIGLARERAEKILAEAHMDETQLQKELAQMIDEAESAHFSEYKQRLQNISKGIESRLEKGADEYSKMLEMETIEAQKAVARRLESEYSQIEKELAEYKERRLKEMEQQIREGLKVGLKKAFADDLTVSEHEELITKAIELAKKKNDF